MLDSERNSSETGTNEAAGHAAGAAPAPTVFNGPAVPAVAAVPAALFQPPPVLFQPPPPVAPSPVSDRDPGDRAAGGRDTGGRDTGGRDAGAGDRDPVKGSGSSGSGNDSGGRDSGGRDSGGRQPAKEAAAKADADADAAPAGRRSRSRSRTARVREAAPDDAAFSVESAEAASAVAETDGASGDTAVSPGAEAAEDPASGRRSRRRRTPRGRSRDEASADGESDGQGAEDSTAADDADGDTDGDADGDGESSATRRRRRKRRRGSGDTDSLSPDDPPDTVVHVREPHNPADDVRAIKGSTRLEAKKQRRREGRESGRRRPPVVTESEFLARRESVDRTMVVRQRGDRTQIAVLEDGILVEHYVNRTSHASYVGNVYLGKVQNVLPSMEAAFVDIGKGRNAVLYAGEVNFDASGLEGQPKRIESALKPGQSVIVQVTKDPVGHKGARLTSQVSLPGRYLVYVPGASMTGISRKLPDTERTRLKQILKKVTPENAGVIVRTAAEGAAEVELDLDITRLAAQWESIEKKAKTATAPALLHGEPDLTIRVVRDVFNEDFSKLIVSGDEGWEVIDEYVRYVAPHLADRISRWDSPDNVDADEDVFADYRIDEQLLKALDRKVWLPSGGSLVIDRTEAMTVIDVNTGKFTGQGGNLEETVTRNNLEAAEEIVRQLRLRDIGGIIVIDFIDMVLESNRELVLRRMLECLARDRTKHQVAEVTSLGLVQMTRKRVGAGLLEAFSQQCECCNGRGVIVTLDAPVESAHRASPGTVQRPIPTAPGHVPANGNGNGRGQGNGSGNAKGGSGNGRRGGDRREDGRNARDNGTVTADTVEADAIAPDTIQVEAGSADPARADTVLADTVLADTAQAGNGPAPVGGAPGGNGARRTRRSTSAGTAFATAVIVDDTPAVTPVTESAPAATAPGDTAGTEAADAPPAPRTRTRTRTGSAVARATVVTDTPPVAPEPSPSTDEPSADVTAPAADEAAPAAEAPASPVDAPAPLADAAPATADAPAPAADVAAPVADAPAPAADVAPTPASSADAAAPSADAAAPAPEAPIAEAPAPWTDDAPAAAEAGQPAEDASAAPAEPSAADTPADAAGETGSGPAWG